MAANFRDDTSEVGLYLAMAHQAQQEGYPEVAETLKTIAWEEAQHAARYALLNGMTSASTKENIERMLAGEGGGDSYGCQSLGTGVGQIHEEEVQRWCQELKPTLRNALAAEDANYCVPLPLAKGSIQRQLTS